MELWGAMESVVRQGGIRYLGVSNIRVEGLRGLYDKARGKPTFVQNWFRRATGLLQGPGHRISAIWRV